MTDRVQIRLTKCVQKKHRDPLIIEWKQKLAIGARERENLDLEPVDVVTVQERLKKGQA